MIPNGGGQPSGDLAAAIDTDLAGFDAFEEAFSNGAATRLGSRWAVKNIQCKYLDDVPDP